MDVGNLISGSSDFSKSSCILVHIIFILLEDSFKKFKIKFKSNIGILKHFYVVLEFDWMKSDEKCM